MKQFFSRIAQRAARVKWGELPRWSLMGFALVVGIAIYADHMEGSSTAKKVLLIASTAGMMFVILYWSIRRQLVPTRSNAVSMLWYFFSLAFVLTILIKWVASANQWIDVHGAATGEIGKFILGLSEDALNIEADLFLALGIPVIVIAPQLLCYVLSGLCKCASPPRWIWATVQMFFYGMAKSFIVAGGVLSPLAWFGYRWGQIPTVLDLVAVETFALMLTAFAFLFLVYAGYVEDMRNIVSMSVDKWTENPSWPVRLHRWMTKDRQPEAVLASGLCPLQASLAIAEIKRLGSDEIEVTWIATLGLQGTEGAALVKSVTSRHPV